MKFCSAVLGAVSAVALVLGSTAAQAGVRYDFQAFTSFATGNPMDTFSGSFSYLAPSFITSTRTIDVGDLSSCTATGNLGAATCRPQDIVIDAGFALVQFNFFTATAEPIGIAYYFNATDFAAAGNYDSQLLGADQFATLTVTNLGGGGPAVPEPSTWALMIGGFGLAGAALRRRRTVVAV